MQLRVFPMLLICLPMTCGCLFLPNHANATTSFEQPMYLAPRRVYLYKTGYYTDAAAKWVNLMQVDINVVAGGGGFSAEGRPLDNQAWGPMFEIGYRARNFFDFFSGFGWYSLTDAKWTYGETDADILSFQLDMTDYQFRVGTRTWIPLHGMGRFGVNAGALLSIIPFGLDVSRQSGGAIQGGSHEDTWTAFGVFGGIDGEVFFRKAFAKARIEGSLVTGNKYEQLLGLAANVNTSAFSFSVGGGIRF